MSGLSGRLLRLTKTYLEAAKEQAQDDPAIMAVALDIVARARLRNIPPAPSAGDLL